MSYSNSFRPPVVKYPYSNLKYSHHNYINLIEHFLESMYGGIQFRVLGFNDWIGICVYGVLPNKIYNPRDFEPSYVVNAYDQNKRFISKIDFFETFYSYIPDVVPYLIFKLYTPYDYIDYNNMISVGPDSSFDEFDLREFYYKEESRKEYYRQLRTFNVDLDGFHFIG